MLQKGQPMEPCPFCGHTSPKVSSRYTEWTGPDTPVSSYQHGHGKEDSRRYQVICQRCYARGPTTQDGERQAIQEWNERVDKVVVEHVGNVG